MKPLILALLLLFAQSDSDLTIKYDKFEDRTVVSLWKMPMGYGSIGQLPKPLDRPVPLELILTAFYDGKRPTKIVHLDDTVYVIISSPSGVPLADHELILLIDGERLRIATQKPISIFKGVEDQQWTRVPMTVALFQRMIAAKSVEGRVGITEFHLTSRNKEEMANFLKAITPQ